MFRSHLLSFTNWRRAYGAQFLFLVVIALAGPPAATEVLFIDITPASRIAFQHAASKTPVKFLPETMGAGVALFDYNNDGWLDIFFTNGARIDERQTSARQPDKRERAYWNCLYQNNGDGTFTDVTERAGLAGTRYDFGAAVGDYDNDGDEDLYVTGYGGNTLYRNKRQRNL